MPIILQLTDTHLFADPGKELYGVNTRHSICSIVEDILRKNVHADAVLLTGDLVHDEGLVAYQALSDIIEQLKVPVYCLPGNHDSLADMRSVFSHVTVDGVLKIELKNWVLILLDSSVTGKVEGYLPESVMKKLADIVTQNQEKPVLLAVHHHVINVGSEWMDRINVTNHEEFRQLLGNFSNVKVVLNGHIHQELDMSVNNIRYLGSPSTCFQFSSNQKQAGIDSLPPAYRTIELKEDGGVHTEVTYINYAK